MVSTDILRLISERELLEQFRALKVKRKMLKEIKTF